jgi:hypothetical protein
MSGSSDIDRIIAAAKKQQRAVAGDVYHATKAAREVASVVRFLAQLAAGLHWCWSVLGRPVWRLVRKGAVWSFWRYLGLWNRFAFQTDAYGAREFSKSRAGGVVLATLAILFVALELASASGDAAVYLLTSHRDETVVLFNSQEIDPKTNLHNTEGCDDWPCPDGGAFYLRVHFSLFNNLWKLATAHTFFYPDAVAGQVPTGRYRCVITYYYPRLRVLGVEIFPQLLDVKSCVEVQTETPHERD